MNALRTIHGWRRDALIYPPNFFVGMAARQLFGWWSTPLLVIWAILFARIIHGEWIWEWW